MEKDNLYNSDVLLPKISKGDQEAFNRLFEKYRNKLFTYLLKITKSSETSEEIVLDVFLKIWHGREALTQIENFDTFLYRAAHNKAIDFLRAVKRNPLLQQQIWDFMQEPVSTENADKSLLYKNTEVFIDEAIKNLSSQRQKVFILHYHHGLKNDEIAQRLSLSRNTVRNHLNASFDFIRKFLSYNLGVILLLFLLKK